VTEPGSRLSGKLVAEALAAVGVIASLLFVGVQIRQSNTQAKAAAYQAIGAATAEAFDSWAHDAALSEVWLMDPAEMDEVEWEQLIRKFTVFARLGEMVLLQIELGVLDPDAMNTLGYGGWRTFLQSGKLACMWPRIEPGVSEGFRNFVEGGAPQSPVDCSSYRVPQPAW
jgi:hypothetical protein